MNKTLLIFILAALAVSGCIEEKEIAPTPQPPEISQPELIPGGYIEENEIAPTPVLPDISQPGSVPGEFEINITSYYFVYLRNNRVIYENTTKRAFDLVEKNYVMYNLSIKNNNTNTLNFSINKLQLHARDQIFTPGDPGTKLQYIGKWLYVLSDIENENRLNNTILHPDQTLKGIIIFKVDNYTTLFDRSFSLRYNTTPIPSTSVENSLEALRVAEQFDYSIAFKTPPYDCDMWEDHSYDFPEHDHPYVWANWVNRTVFESYRTIDEMSMSKEKPGNIPHTEIAYAVKVIPEQDLTIFHTDHSTLYEERNSGPYNIRSEGKYKETQLYVVDDTGEEIFNRSICPLRDDIGLVILDDQTYRPFSENMPNMLIPRATIVHFSFNSIYGWSFDMRLTFNDQDIILDEQHNIILARYDFSKMVS